MRWKSVLVVVLAVALSSAATAQIVDPGLNWAGSSGTFAGPLCGGFTCTPVQVPVSVNEIVTLTVRGTLNTAYAIAISTTANQCLAIPGVQNALILDFPVTVALTGIFVDGDGILACPGGRAVITFAFPFLPPWTLLSIQAVAQRPDLTLSLTSAITVWVL